MNKITRPQPAENQVSKPRYGFQWWFDRHKKSGDDDLIVTGYGYGGQRLYIDRRNDIVAVFTGWTIYEKNLSYGIYNDYILSAVNN